MSVQGETAATQTPDEFDLSRLWELSLDVLAIANFDGYFVHLNDRWTTLLGYSRDELLSRPFIEFVHPDDLDATVAAAAGLSEGHDLVSFENRYLTKSGQPRWLRWAAQADIERERIYCTAKDVTADKQLTSSLARANADLVRSNKDLEHFAYVASHDLGEPLRKVASYCDLLERRYEDQLDERGRGYIASAVGATRRMQQLINDLLAFSRAGREDRREEVDLRAVLADVEAMLSTAIEDRGVEVVIGDLPAVEADRVGMRQVLQNLVANGIKFHDAPGGRVSVTAERGEGEWIIHVADDGIGMAPEHTRRIFEVFERLNPREKYDGTGIGLAIARRLVERRGGRIWAESTLGEGTTMKFTIPFT